MLVLKRQEGQEIIISTPTGDELVITITEGSCGVGIQAPREYKILRDELLDKAYQYSTPHGQTSLMK